MTTIQVFDNDDNAYLDWMDNNPSYFIVNAPRTNNSANVLLHKSKCHHVTTTAGLEKGAYTEKNNIKIGSDDLNALKSWFVENNPKFLGDFKECKTCKPFSEKFNDNPIFLFPDTIENENEILYEGAKKQITVNSYERNLKARQECIKHYGNKCCVCETDFEQVYGIIGKDFIHVHHLKEISDIVNTYIINPIDDLRPVCPNCHSMLHQRKPCFTIDELTSMMK
jgi:5-methylcytosine-specific restriction protein A